MSSSDKSKYTLTGIAIAVSLLLAFTVSVSFNWYYTNYYLKQEITNIFNQFAEKINETEVKVPEIPPIQVNVTLPNVTSPQPNVTQPIPVPPVPQPAPVPTPKPQPTCEPDERYNTTLKKCIEIAPEVCTSQQVYNRTDNRCYSIPLPACPEDQTYNTVTKKCETEVIPNPTETPTPPPQPTPAPTPTPVPTTLKVIITGDVESSGDSLSVYNRIKAQNPNEVFVLGDLGYSSSLSWFKSTYGTLGDRMWCSIGNHDSANEDGTASLEKEAKNYCGNTYWVKRGVNLFVVINTNDADLKTLSTKTGSIFSNQTIMKDVKNVHFLSHKPYSTGPNSHHPVEAAVKAFYDTVKSKVPSGIKVFYIAAHNHVMAATADGTFKTIGAGGRSHYECGINTVWVFCDNVHYGFLQLTLTSDGAVKYQFMDYNGKVLLSK